MQNLTEMQTRFVLAYTTNANTFGNGTRSAMAAGYSDRTARVQAQQLLALEHVQRAKTYIEMKQMLFVLKALGRAVDTPALSHRVRVRAIKASMALVQW